MKAINKLFIIIFSLVVSGSCTIFGVVINSTVWKAGFIPADLERTLSWFGQHPNETKVITYSAWGIAGFFTLVAILALIGIAKDKRTTADEELGIEYKRLED